MATKHWSKMAERGSYLGMRFLLLSYRILGRTGLWIVLFPVVFYFYCTGRVARTASLDFLRRVAQYQHQTTQPGFWQGLKHFMSFADSAFDKIDAWTGRISAQDIDYENHALFEQLQNSGQGAVFIGSHLGNLEVCRALSVGRYQVKINVLVFTHHAVEFNRTLQKISPNVNVDLIQVTDMKPELAIILQQKIDAGEVVVIVGDRTSTSVSQRVSYCDFLGAPAPFSQGPFILAAVLDCPVYLLFCLKHKNRYRVIFELFAEQLTLPRKTRQAALQSVIQRYADRLAFFSLQAPYQWFNFFDFWQKDDCVSRDD
ncbi:acyltransferase [Pseudoalteromonas ulvae]|uniref:Acyltransferase n=1 Tax=Pseudoalteromonas ulvae TaxID=107327 RepID=A0A244CMN4_PSEDV|nr:acyltransferase [Pseudoalteromonas ulvae]OUL56469.1 acyltransferase [Pseudoalteromonas ulvae]